MFKFQIEFDQDVIKEWLTAIEQSPKTTAVFAQKTVVGVIKNELAKVNKYPGPVKYPIDWTSEKQRRAYFATDGFGHGIPYKRKGTLFDSTVVDLSENPLTLTIVNNNPVARYVIGDDQQRFHKNTGWRRMDDDYLNIMLKAQDMIIDGWYSIITQKGLK